METQIEVNVNELANILAAQFKLESAYIGGVSVAEPGKPARSSRVGVGGQLTITFYGTSLSEVMPGERGYIPKFCEDCGTKLEWSEKSRFAFDEDTGVQKFVQHLICPKRRWYQVLHRAPLKQNYPEKLRYNKFSEEES